MPQNVVPVPLQNKILAALPAEEYARIHPTLVAVSLSVGERLYKTEGRIEYVYFPTTAVVSFVAHLKEGASVEVGLVGNEGMLGIPLILGDNLSPNDAIVQIPRLAMRMKSSALITELKRAEQLRFLLLRFTLASLKQISQTAACNRSHHVAERLARWLLTCHDRVQGEEINVTQEVIAEMLGTRRSGVNEAAMQLQSAGLTRHSRGHITILNRTGLENFACECYAAVKIEFERLLGQ